MIDWLLLSFLTLASISDLKKGHVSTLYLWLGLLLGVVTLINKFYFVNLVLVLVLVIFNQVQKYLKVLWVGEADIYVFIVISLFLPFYSAAAIVVYSLIASAVLVLLKTKWARHPKGIDYVKGIPIITVFSLMVMALT